MTEAEWVALRAADGAISRTTDRPVDCLREFFAAKGSRRRSRLFACACIRTCCPNLSDKEAAALDGWERVADGGSERVSVLMTAWRPGKDVWGSRNDSFWAMGGGRDPHIAAADTARFVETEGAASCRREDAVAWYDGGGYHRAREAIVRVQWQLVRCLFAETYRPASCDPGWRTAAAVALAEAIYAGRAFDRLPVLADALEEAGCDNADVLAHCRGDGPHARGCWVVDMVLGKT